MPHSGREQNPVHWRCPYLLEPWPTRQTPGGAGNREDKDDRNLGRNLPERQVRPSRRLLGTLWLEESEA